MTKGRQKNGWRRIHVYAPHSSSISIDETLLDLAQAKLGSWEKLRAFISAEVKKSQDEGTTRSRQVNAALLKLLAEGEPARKSRPSASAPLPGQPANSPVS